MFREGLWALAFHLRPRDLVGWNSCLACQACRRSPCSQLLEVPWQASLQLLSSYPDRRLVPDVLSFTSCLPRLAWRSAAHLLRHMRQALVEPNLVSLSAARLPWPRALRALPAADERLRGATAAACARGRQWREAVEVLRPLSVIGCNAAMKGCGHGAWEIHENP